jgi:hypothetical protein
MVRVAFIFMIICCHSVYENNIFSFGMKPFILNIRFYSSDTQIHTFHSVIVDICLKWMTIL